MVMVIKISEKKLLLFFNFFGKIDFNKLTFFWGNLADIYFQKLPGFNFFSKYLFLQIAVCQIFVKLCLCELGQNLKKS